MIIGILHPRSKVHPGIGMDFLEGIKQFLKKENINNNIDILYESIGFGGNEKEVYEKAEKLLVLENVDLLVAYIDLRVLPILQPLLYASGKLMIVINPGANYPENWVSQPNIINLGLQHAFLCWLTGAEAGKLPNNNALMASTFYDCGYLHTSSMVKGFVKSGGEITFNYVNNQSYNDSFEIEQLTDYLISDRETNNLLCIFDSLPAALFYKHLNKFAEARRLQLFVSPMMLEENALKERADGFQFSIEGYAPWHSSLTNNSNADFIGAYSKETGKLPTIFSLLGWETGMILQQLFLNNNEYKDGSALANQLKTKIINSPRGDMFLDEMTHYFISPVYKCSLAAHSKNMKIELVEHPHSSWEEFISEPLQGISSGWTNTYLCY